MPFVGAGEAMGGATDPQSAKNVLDGVHGQVVGVWETLGDPKFGQI
jgi:hypothetical protein